MQYFKILGQMIYLFQVTNLGIENLSIIDNHLKSDGIP